MGSFKLLTSAGKRTLQEAVDHGIIHPRRGTLTVARALFRNGWLKPMDVDDPRDWWKARAFEITDWGRRALKSDGVDGHPKRTKHI